MYSTATLKDLLVNVWYIFLICLLIYLIVAIGFELMHEISYKLKSRYRTKRTIKKYNKK